jgi:hypothetical protein
MAKQRFVSGRLKLDVSFNDRTDKYRVRVCPTVKGERCETVTVGPPRGGSRSVHGKRLSVDDPRAMKQAAHAAISFGRGDLAQYADHNRRGSGYLVRPARRARRKRS